MASNAQKTWFARTLNRAAEQAAIDAIEVTGRALPAKVVSVDGQIVTVSFSVQAAAGAQLTIPNVTMPIASSIYMRVPIQAGDTGMVIPADVSLGQASGLGSGTPRIGLVANLSALVFVPVSSSSWPASEDPNAFVLLGPDGVILRSVDGTVKIKATKTEVSITAPIGVPIVLNGTVVITQDLQLAGQFLGNAGGVYTGAIKVGGQVIAGFGTGDQVGLQSHQHTQPNDSHGDGEQPTAAPTPGT